jgi:hypothetical protein
LRSKLVIKENGEVWVRIGEVTVLANNIIREMNEEGQELRIHKDDEGEKKKKGYEVGAQRVGRIMKEIIQLKKMPRRNDGVFCIWDDVKLEIAGKKYGVLPDEQKIKDARLAMVKLNARVDVKREPLQMAIEEPVSAESEHDW